MHLAPGLRIPNGLPKERDLVSISHKIILNAIEDEERRDHVDPDVDYSFYKPTAFHDVRTLQLSFHNIGKIDHLASLSALTELKLDNNQITKIRNLDALVNLKWLDLSFNKIEQIEGLDKLTNLTDLSLCSNLIDTVENLDGLTKLEVLSLGTNKITGLKTIPLFRELPSLKVLNLSNNPVAEEPDYRAYCLAYIPWLHYLDYEEVEKEDAIAARESGVPIDDIREMDELAQKRKRQEEKEKEKQRMLDEYKEHFVDAGCDLLECLFREDTLWEDILKLQGTDQLKECFYVDVEKACQEFLSTGLESGKRIVEEAECFRKALSVLRAKSDARANKLIVQYMKEHKKTMRMVTEGVSEILDDDNKTCQQQIEKLQELRRQLNELKRDAGILEKSLTKEEIERQGHVNHLQEHFEIELQLLKEAKLGIHTTFFRQIEQFAIDLHSRLLNWSDKAHATLNKSWDSTGATNETPQAGNVFSFSAFSTLSEDLKELLSNKELIEGTLKNLHENRTSIIIALEDSAKANEQKRCEQLNRRFKIDEQQFRRGRVEEIHHQKEKQINSIEEMSEDLEGQLKELKEQIRARSKSLSGS